MTRGSTPAASFRVTNDGTGALRWGVDSWPDWVEVLEPLYSGVNGDGTVRIRVRSDAALGRHAGRITFNSNGGDDPITLSVSIVAPPSPELFDAQAQDIWLDPSIVYEDDTADVKAKFRNLSSSSGPYDGEATFDVAIIVYPPSGSGTRYFVNNTAFSYNQEKTYTMRNFTFNRSGTYTVHAEIYDINGEESGWDAAHRFDRLSETFIIDSPPELVASPSSHDFGTVTRGSTPAASFRVTNDGTGALRWGVDSWPDWVEVLEPLYSGVNGDGTVRIRVRSDAALGRHAGRITFNSNGGDDPITLSANIIAPPSPELGTSPNGHDFSTVTRGSTPEASFRVTNDGTGALRWGVDSWPDWVEVLEPLYSGVNGDGAVRIRVRSDAALGRHTGRITFNSNGGDESIILWADIVAPPSPELGTSPNGHDFGTVTRGSTPEASFRVTNSGTGALQWGVNSLPDWVDILEPLVSGVKGDGAVRIRVRSDAALGRHTGRIRFNSNGGDDPITLSANIIAPPSPDLGTSPNGHDFSTVTRGSTPEASFRVTNDGTGALRWGVDSWPDWVEVLEPLYSGVNGDGAVRIRVRSDAALGRHTGRITFNSNGGDESIILWADIVAPPSPELGTSPNGHDFGTVTRGSTPEASFRVTNSGTGALQWGVNSLPDWVDILEPLVSGVKGDGAVRIRVRSDAALGRHTGRITFNSNGGDESIILWADIVAPPSPELDTSPNGHDFGTVTWGSTPAASISVANIGGGLLQWSVLSWPSWVTVLEPSTSNEFGSGKIRVQMLNTAAGGNHAGSIEVESNGGNRSIPLSVEVKPTESLRLEPPTNLTIGLSANDSINLSWDPVDAWVEGFELYVTESGSSRRWSQVVDGSKTDAWVRNLVPGTEYKLSAAAFHGAKQSSQSTPVTGATYPRRTSTTEVIIESNRVAAVYWDGHQIGTINQPVGRVGPRYQFRIASATKDLHKITLRDLGGTTVRKTTTSTGSSTPTFTKWVDTRTNETVVGPVVFNFTDSNSGVDDALSPLYLPPDNVRAALMVGNEVLISWDILPDAPVKRFSIEQRTPDSEPWTIVNPKVHRANRAATVQISAPTEVLDYRVTAIYENSSVSSYPVRAAATLFVLADKTTPDIRTATGDLAEKLRQRPGLETLVVREADLRHSPGSPNLADYNLVVIGEPGSDSQLNSLVTEVFESAGESAVLDPEGAVTFARRSIDCERISVRADAGVLVAPHPLNPNLTAILISGEEIHVEEIIRSSGFVTGAWDWGKDTAYGVAFLLQVVFTTKLDHVLLTAEVVTERGIVIADQVRGGDLLNDSTKLTDLVTYPDFFYPGGLSRQEYYQGHADLAVYAWENPSEVGVGLWNSLWEPYTKAWRCGDYGYAIGYGAPEVVTVFFGLPIKAGTKAASVARTLKVIGIGDNLASTLGKSGKYAAPLEDLVKRVDKVGSKQDKDGLRDAITRGAATKAGKGADAQGKAAFEVADEFVALTRVLGYKYSLEWIQTHMGPVGKRYNDLSFEDATKILAEEVKAGGLDEVKFKTVVDDATDLGKQSEVRLAAAFVQEGWQLVDIKHIILGKFDKKIHKGEIDFLVRREGITMGVETSLHFKMNPQELAFKQNYVRTVLEKNPDNDVMYIGVTSSKKIRGGVGGADALEEGKYLWAHIEP